LSASQDDSFLSKIDILERLAFHYAHTPTLLRDLVFGVGIGESIDNLGIYSHILLVTLVFEFGLTGAFLYVSFLVIVLRNYPLSRWPLGALLVTSLSYFLYVGGPFFFVPLAVLVNFERSAAHTATVRSRINPMLARRGSPLRTLGGRDLARLRGIDHGY